MQTTLATYATIAANMTRSPNATAAKPDVARETACYVANIGNVKPIDDFLGNLVSQSFAAGIGSDVLATLQNLKLGGH